MGFQPTSLFWGEFLSPSNLRGGGWKPFSPFQLAKPGELTTALLFETFTEGSWRVQGPKILQALSKAKATLSLTASATLPAGGFNWFWCSLSSGQSWRIMYWMRLEYPCHNHSCYLISLNIIEYHLISSNIYMRCNIYIYLCYVMAIDGPSHLHIFFGLKLKPPTPLKTVVFFLSLQAVNTAAVYSCSPEKETRLFYPVALAFWWCWWFWTWLWNIFPGWSSQHIPTDQHIFFWNRWLSRWAWLRSPRWLLWPWSAWFWQGSGPLAMGAVGRTGSKPRIFMKDFLICKGKV